MCSFKKEKPELVYRNLFKELIHKLPNPNIQIYTDESKTQTSIRIEVISYIHQNATQLFKLNIHIGIYENT